MAYHHTRHHKKREHPDWPREMSKQALIIPTRRMARKELHRQRGLALGAANILPPYPTAIPNGPGGLAEIRPRSNGDDPAFRTYLLFQAERARLAAE